MSKKTGSVKSAQFILCEDIREEARGKMSLMGTFAGNRIEIQDPSPRPDGKGVAVLHSLGLVAMLRGGPSVFDVKLVLKDPNNQTIGEAVFAGTQIKGDGTATLVLKIPGFLVTAFGTYRAEYNVQGQLFPFSFDILAAGSDSKGT